MLNLLISLIIENNGKLVLNFKEIPKQKSEL